MTSSSHPFIPAMSDNVWQVIQDTLARPASRRYLEWGSGSSTLAAIHTLLPLDRSEPFEIVSVEHDPTYFRSLVQRTLQLLEASGEQVTLRWHDPFPDRDRLSEWRRAHSRRAHLESRLIPWLWCTGNLGRWLVGKPVPDVSLTYDEFLLKVLSVVRCKMAFYLEGFRSFIKATRNAPYRPPEGGWSKESALRDAEHLAVSRPHSLTLCTPKLTIRYYFLPRRENLLANRRRLMDGLYVEFFEYVEVPVEGEFDVILVDGRARSSCIRRVALDSLLAPGGTLFVHDADRVHQMDGYHAFDRHSFIRGSNRRLDGSIQVPCTGVLTIVESGSSPADLQVVADRELFMYKRPSA